MDFFFSVPDTEIDTSVMAKKQEPSQTTGDTGEGKSAESLISVCFSIMNRTIG